MPQPRRHASDAQRQAAYRQRRRLNAKHPPLPTEALVSLPRPSQIPGTVRWRQMLTQVQGLLEMVGREMQDYSDQRSDKWHEGDNGDAFQERMDAVAQARENVDELLT